MPTFLELMGALDALTPRSPRPAAAPPSPQRGDGPPVAPVVPAPPDPPPAAGTPAAGTPAAVIAAPPRPIPQITGLAVTPWSHQVEGYSVLMGYLEQYQAALAAAEMGVGKTLVCTMCALGVGAQRILVVCPLRVINSWADQLSRYLDPPARFVALDDRRTTAGRAEMAEQAWQHCRVTGERLVVAVNYDAFWREPLAGWIAGRTWDMVIYDESHRLKGASGRASLMAKRLHGMAKYRMLATGTPLAHSPLDAYGQFRAVAPWLFGTNFQAFKQKYARLGGPNRKWIVGYQNVDDLRTKMAALTWRATKREALPDLPEEQEIEYETEMSPEGLRVYREVEKDFISEIADGKVIVAQNALTKVLRLQQITGGSVPDDEGKPHKVDDAKAALLEDTLEDLLGSGQEAGKLGETLRPVVVFCRFRHDLDTVHEVCARLGVESRELSGKRSDLEAWQQGDGTVLAVQMQAGSVGISLVRASVAIYYSLTPTLVDFDQSRARIHRPGQTQKCLYIYLVAKNTIDARILRALRARKDVIETIMSEIQAEERERSRKKGRNV